MGAGGSGDRHCTVIGSWATVRPRTVATTDTEVVVPKCGDSHANSTGIGKLFSTLTLTAANDVAPTACATPAGEFTARLTPAMSRTEWSRPMNAGAMLWPPPGLKPQTSGSPGARSAVPSPSQSTPSPVARVDVRRASSRMSAEGSALLVLTRMPTTCTPRAANVVATVSTDGPG